MVDVALQKHFIAIFTVFKGGLMPYQELCEAIFWV